MAWDNDKSTAADPDNPNADEQLTADEWDQHVADGHWLSEDFTLGTESGDPVIRDPQNSNQVVLRYDRSEGQWVMDSLSTDEGTISGKGIIGMPPSSNSGVGDYGIWRQVSAERPAFIIIEGVAETDGSASGRVGVQVDESGGQSDDYTLSAIRAPASLGSGAVIWDTLSLLIPAGAQYQVANISDPNSNNDVKDVREFVL
jgi:hypothetical protein